MANNNLVQQEIFDGANTQRWVVTHVGNEVYTIQSAQNTNYYLGVAGNSTTNGANVVLRTGTVTNGMKWRIAKGVQGYKLVSCLSSSRVLKATDSTVASNLVSGTYTADTDYRDEWEMYRIDTTVNLDLMYDNAYLSRYPSAVSRLNGELLKLQEKFVSEFGIWIACSGPHKFDSYADVACSAPWNQECGHGECTNSTWSALQTHHHKNIYNIMLRITPPDMTQTFRMAYIGHITCSVKKDENHRGAYLGLTFPSKGLISITNFGFLASEIKTMVHEFGHLYGAPDHYNIGDVQSTEEIVKKTGNYGFNENCIYGENKEHAAVLSNLTICDGCRSVIQQNSNDYNHG